MYRGRRWTISGPLSDGLQAEMIKNPLGDFHLDDI